MSENLNFGAESNPLFYFGFSHLRIRLSKQVHLLNHLLNFLEFGGPPPFLRNLAIHILEEMPRNAQNSPIFDAGHHIGQGEFLVQVINSAGS